MDEHQRLTADEVATLDGLDQWRVVLQTLRADFETGSYPAAADLVRAIADAAEQAAHHPDLDVRYPGRVGVALTTHATGGLTMADVELARSISALAAAAGANPSQEMSQLLELAIDASDIEAIRPFWRAVLGYHQLDDGTLVDPARRGPVVWFQRMDEPRRQRNRIHLDVDVPHDEADARIAAALAAGGTLVSDRRARAFWILADAEGNEVCVCTWQDRN
ncbi:MAG: VOC family protein [Actinomycetota bacterium]